MLSKTSRRAFLATIGGLAVGVLAACQQTAAPASKPADAAKPAEAPKPTAAAAIVPPTAAPAAPAVATQAPAAKPAEPKPAADAKPAAGSPKRGGELRIAQTNDFVSMDPIYSSGPTAYTTYEALFAWRPNDKGVYGVQPLLAKSWEISGNKLTIKLQPNVKFHDGSDLNADAVAWNVKRMVQDPKSFARTILPQVDTDKPAEAIDPLTVQINMKRPSAGILAALSDGQGTTLYTGIVSKKSYDEKGPDWVKLNPVGTGPFKFVSFASGDKLVVEKNPSYWQMGADGKPLPYADKITYRVIIDASTQFTEMRSATTDLITNIRGRDVPAAKQIPTATYIESPFQGNKYQFFFNSKKPIFADNLKLRQAIQYAIDRDAMAKTLGAGLGVVLPYEFVPGAIGYDTSVPAYTFDLDKAKALFKESGVAPGTEIRLTAHNRETDSQQAQLIQAMLDKIGIKVNLDIVERVAWGEKVRINNDYEMASRVGGVVMDPSLDLLQTWAESGNSAYHRAHVDGLLETLQKADEEYDDTKRADLFKQAQKLMYESAWMVYMWFANGNFLVNKRIQGFPATWGAMREAEWWINE